MQCAWKELLSILPTSIRCRVEMQDSRQLQEIRLRLHQPVQLRTSRGIRQLEGKVREEEMQYVVNTASKFSPWLCVTSAAGYITAPGGHRIGMCGDAVIRDGCMTGFRSLRSLNIRVCRQIPGIGKNLVNLRGSMLIIGPPGCGKTTLLRDLIHQRSCREAIGVVDERGELFPGTIQLMANSQLDILTGCRKALGIEVLLRTMAPDTIAVDEITAEEDCKALISATGCGVALLATAHAGGREDFWARPVYAPLIKAKLFEHLVIMHPDKTWILERMYP